MCSIMDEDVLMICVTSFYLSLSIHGPCAALIYLYCLYFIFILCWFWTSFNMFRWKSKLSYWKCYDTFWRKFEDLSHTCIYLFTLSAFPVFVKEVGLNLNSSINLHSEPSFDWWVRHAPNGYLTYNLTLYTF